MQNINNDFNKKAMIKKISITIVCLIFFVLGSTSHVFCQNGNETKEARFYTEDGNMLYQRLHDFGYTHQTERHALDTLCNHGYAFVKFKISSRSVVTDISFSDGTPPAIAQYMSKALSWTDGHWVAKTINGKPTESKFMFLPIAYLLGINCEKIENSSFNNFWKMLWFDGLSFKTGQLYNNGNTTLDCIILHPYLIKSPTY